MTESSAPINSLREDIPQIAPAPRPITAKARRRSWAEMPVRVWLILTITVAVVTIYFTINRVHEAMQDRWLILHGTDVNAKFTMVNGDPFPKRRPRNETMQATIEYTINGTTYTPDFSLEAKPGAFAMVGTIFPIKIDPNDPTQWREVTEPKPWAQELTTLGFLVPLLALLLAVTILRRRGMLKVWRDGSLLSGEVVEIRQSAIAPRSRIARFILRDGEDRRVWATLVPTSAGIPAKGETIWLIALPNRLGRSIMARLYQS
jgi:hypothetical protein